MLTDNGVGSLPTFQAAGAASLPSGSIIGSVHEEYSTSATLGTLTPFDDSIPQITEGVQVLTATVTPSSTSSTILIKVAAQVSATVAGTLITTAVHRNSSTDAIAASFSGIGSGDHLYPMHLSYEDSPSTTSAVTYTVRIGANTNGCVINGNSSGRIGGGSQVAAIDLMEIKA